MSHSPNPGTGPSAEATSSTSSGLLERVKAREPEAWQRLARLYSPMVYSWCRRFEVATEDAKDVLQEVFRAVHSGIARFRGDRPGDSFRGWLWTITRNKIRDHCRARQGQAKAEGGTTAQQQLQEIPESLPDESSSPGTSGRIVHRALELMRTDFQQRSWRAFWLTAIEDRPPAEVADALGISVAAVWQAKSRVLRRLRQELGGLAEE